MIIARSSIVFDAAEFAPPGLSASGSDWVEVFTGREPCRFWGLRFASRRIAAGLVGLLSPVSRLDAYLALAVGVHVGNNWIGPDLRFRFIGIFRVRLGAVAFGISTMGVGLFTESLWGRGVLAGSFGRGRGLVAGFRGVCLVARGSVVSLGLWGLGALIGRFGADRGCFAAGFGGNFPRTTIKLCRRIT